MRDLPPVPGGIRDKAGTVIAPDPATLPPHEFDLAVLWQHPNLLFAQTCWGPLELWLEMVSRVIGQDDYSGMSRAGRRNLYSSAIVMREPRNRQRSGFAPSDWLVCALPTMSTDSMSGYLALERELHAHECRVSIFSAS